MARGRMLVKEIASDARLWEQMSKEARNAFLWVIPHQEGDGTVPRNPRDLRLMAFPCDKDMRDADLDSFIAEWVATNPPIAAEVETRGGRKRLKLNDFPWANENLSSKERVKRHRQRNAGNGSNASNARREEKRSEGKRSELTNDNDIRLSSIRMPWGEWRNVPVLDLEPSYCKWLLDNKLDAIKASKEPLLEAALRNRVAIKKSEMTPKQRQGE